MLYFFTTVCCEPILIPFNSLRSVVSALFWLTIGVAAAICIALSAVSQDPYLVWMYGSLGIVGFVAGCAFYVCFYPRKKI